MADVGLVRVLNEGAVVLRVLGYATRSDPDAIWTVGKQRKLARCWITDAPLEPGDEAFRPVGNQDYRGRRIHPGVVAALVSDAREKGLLDG